MTALERSLQLLSKGAHAIQEGPVTPPKAKYSNKEISLQNSSILKNRNPDQMAALIDNLYPSKVATD